MIMDNRFLVARRRYDPDATRYINAVQLADGQALEPEVAMAVDAFVRGCKADGIWSAIKASCILCGARTISGALVPLVGTAPTNVADGFVSGDYTRGGATPGLKGDGTSYLDSGRSYSADSATNNHIAGYVTQQPTLNSRYIIGARTTQPDLTLAGYAFVNHNTVFAGVGDPVGVGLHAVARADNTEAKYVKASGAVTSSAGAAVLTPLQNPNFLVFTFASSDSSPNAITDARLAFYSIGSSLDLAALDTRVTALVTAIGAAV